MLLQILALCIVINYATNCRDSSLRHFDDYLLDKLEDINAKIKANNQSIAQIRSSLITQISQLHVMDASNTSLWSNLTHSQDRFEQNITALLTKQREIEEGLHEIEAVSERESPAFRCLIALCRGLKNKSLPSDVLQLIVLDEKERTDEKNVQFIIDYGFASGESLYSKKPIRSLKNIIFPVFPDDCDGLIDLSHHPIASYQNAQFPEYLGDLDLSYTTLNTQKLKQVRFPALEFLYLSGNPNISSFENISFPSCLFGIDLSKMSLNSAKMRSLKLPRHLQKIDMDHNALQGQIDALNELIASLPDLDQLDIGYCNLTTSDFAKLSFVAAEELHYLILSGNSNDDISALRLPQNLKSLQWKGVTWNHTQLLVLDNILPNAVNELHIGT